MMKLSLLPPEKSSFGQIARISALRYGGEWQDWIAIHDWIDRSKAIFPSMQHRMFLHSDFGEWLTVRIHGESINAEDGAVISTRDLFRDHQVEDLGRVVTLAEWLHEVDADYWARRRKPPRQLEQVREEPAQGLAARWGGVAGDYLALIDFFDKPCEFASNNPDAAAMITHNSFGIFLAEELLGTTFPIFCHERTSPASSFSMSFPARTSRPASPPTA